MAMTQDQSNATHWNGEIRVTKLFAHFVSSTTYGTLSSTMKPKLKELLLDYPKGELMTLYGHPQRL